MITRLLPLLLASLILVSCGPSAPPATFTDLARDYVYTYLSLNPSTATQAGYHTHPGIPLDGKMETFSSTELNQLKGFLDQFQKRIDGVKVVQLSAEERADYDILTAHLQLSRLELETLQSHRHNPTLYVELLGNAIFSLYMLDFAPIEQRYDAIISRLNIVPALLESAQRNLVDAPEIWVKVALQENDGNHEMLIKTLKETCPPSRRVYYDRSSGIALTEMQRFNSFLESRLSKNQSGWRLGKEKFAAKFRLTLGLDQTPEQVLADAEQQLDAVRKEMFKIAAPLHQRFFPGASRSDLNTVVGQTLRKISETHGTRESYMADAGRDLEEARQFVRKKNIVELPASDNLKVIETPVFMRGIYSVGGFNPAPPLEPALGAYYWLTPIPVSWPAARIDSKLREYNFYGLKLLTIHEAVPGHYVQFEYANGIASKTRRLLRALLGNGPYIEGWAVYATETMLDEGLLDHSPELRLTFMKQQLRMISNAILDIRMHTMNMTDEQAMELMIQQTFQEKEEAEGKLTRAKLSSTQLCTYFTGWREWRRLREKVQKSQGSSFNLAAFHEKALRAGAVPMPALTHLMMARN